MYRAARAARIYDGPDEVHRQTVARRVLKGYVAARGADRAHPDPAGRGAAAVRRPAGGPDGGRVGVVPVRLRSPGRSVATGVTRAWETAGMRVSHRLGLVGATVAGALLVSACGSSGSGVHPRHISTSSTAAPASTTTPTTSSTTSTTSSTPSTSGSGSGPMVTATLPVVVCQTTSGVTTTTAALPGSVSVSVPSSAAGQGNLAVYSDESGA